MFLSSLLTLMGKEERPKLAILLPKEAPLILPTHAAVENGGFIQLIKPSALIHEGQSPTW
jgi:hypothetical protein